MEKSIDDRPAKRLKTTFEQNFCSTFERFSAELILNLFEYFNTKEIFQSFSNLNSFITSCIFDPRQQLHLHLDRQIPSLSDNYSPDNVISLHIEHVDIPMDTLVNLKSLTIVYKHVWEAECLNMVNEISELSQLINFKLLLVGSELSSIDDKVIKIALGHSSLQRIILSRNHSKPHFYAWRKNSSLKMVFAAVQLVYVISDSSSMKTDNFRNRSRREMSLSLTPQYHVHHLDLNFKSWKLHLLAEFLSALPLLITLKIKGFCCCNHMTGWLSIHIWDQILQKLTELQRVAIEICLAIPMRLREGSAKRFNEYAAQQIQTCKRINLTAGRRIKAPNVGCVEISASLNMD